MENERERERKRQREQKRKVESYDGGKKKAWLGTDPNEKKGMRMYEI